MQTLTRRVVAIAMLTSTAALGACGSDDDRLTAEEFLEQGNAICEETTAAMDEASAAFAGREPTPEELETFIDDDLVPAADAFIDDLGALNPPEDMQDSVDQLLASVQTAIDELDPTSLEDPFADFNARATELGLTACAADTEGE